jgi:O-antigen ligase
MSPADDGKLLMMLTTLIVLCVFIWLPILCYLMIHRRFWILIIWLLVAPIVTNLAQGYLVNPFFSMQQQYWVGVSDRYDTAKYWQTASQDITLQEVLAEPTRFVIFALLLFWFLDTLLLKNRHPPLNATESWMILFLLIILANIVLLSQRVPYSLRITLDTFVIPFASYFLARRLIINEQQFRKLVQILGYLGLYVIVISFFERLLHTDFTYRLRGPFIQSGEQGYFNVLIVVFYAMLSSLDFGNQMRPRRLAVFPPVVCRGVLCCLLILLLLTWSRGNWMGLFSGVTIFLLLGHRLSHPERRLGVIGMVFCSLPIAAIIVLCLLPEQVIETRVVAQDTVTWRFQRWALAFQEGLQHPLFGIGFNNLRHIFVKKLGNFYSTHNSYLTFFAEFGLVGLLTYIAVVGSIIWSGLQLFWRGLADRDRWLGVVVIAVMVSHLIPAFFSDTIEHTGSMLIYLYVFAGGVVGISSQRLSKFPTYSPFRRPRFIFYSTGEYQDLSKRSI